MKNFFQKRKRFFLICSLILLGGFFVLQNCPVEASKLNKIRGWAWSENTGWLSLNCYNEELADPKCNNDYGVDYSRETGDLVGSAWSEHFGWLCLGSTCNVWGAGNSPDSVPAEAVISDKGVISGWAWWKNLEEDGWLKLLGPVASKPGSFIECRNCSGRDCGFCFSNEDYLGSEKFCSECSDCSFDFCLDCNSCYEYGVGLDYSSNTLVGWAWNGDSLDHGFGWLSFHPATYEVVVNPAYVETISGDVYSQEGIGDLYSSAPPIGKNNATYLLQTNGDIVHWSSENDWLDEDSDLTFPDQENNYLNEFGFLDLKGILAGHYGARENIESILDIDDPLDGKVYYYDATRFGGADFEINSDWIIKKGLSKGSGTLVVKGNLKINAEISYENLSVDILKKLPSLGIIVIDDGGGLKGNIIIDENVENLVGSLFAEGKISTGNSFKQLTHKGLMISKEFDFGREYADFETQQGAERIIYDGRVISNPPPGFVDLKTALPDFY